MKNMISAIISILLIVLFCLYLGETSISFSPFEIKLKAWDKLIGIVLMVVAFGFLQYHYRRVGFSEGLEFCKKILFEKDNGSTEETSSKEFSMIVLRKTNPKILEKLDSLGYLPISSVHDKINDSSWILLAGNRYSIILEPDSLIDFDAEILIDCHENEEMFFRVIGENQKYTDENR